MAKPFVSVLIDTYNHERFIEKAIVSVLEQDFPAAEREILVRGRRVERSHAGNRSKI